MYPLRVRYQETDQMAVVFHANYVTWFEVGRTELIRHAGYRYADIEQAGLLLPVTELHCRFGRPARYDDPVMICTRLAAVSAVRIAFESQIRTRAQEDDAPRWWAGEEPPGELLVEGGTRHVWVNRDWRPMRLDRAQPELHAAIMGLYGGDARTGGREEGL
ncbi:acyl-CoA thioesterase [Paenibacillus sp. IB182496]|uniref:Acyl-CoA thioesterase n=1 Tax=Paenibacillus sabuli TaxID=2772509 RepID=A0A927BQ60_9BACL|nr:acyl-CoA thioesterase [Paenibacillus sabuli]